MSLVDHDNLLILRVFADKLIFIYINDVFVISGEKSKKERKKRRFTAKATSSFFFWGEGGRDNSVDSVDGSKRVTWITVQ